MQILDQYIQESNLSFTFKNIPIYAKYAFKNYGDLNVSKERYIKLINNCKNMEDIKIIRNDIPDGIKYFNEILLPSYKLQNKDKDKLTPKEKALLKKIKPYIKAGTTEKDIKDYVNWLKTDARKLLNDKAKEIRNK